MGYVRGNELPNYNPIDPNAHFLMGALHRNNLFDQMKTCFKSNMTYIQARKVFTNVFTLMYGMNNLTDRVFRTLDIGASYISTAADYTTTTIASD